MNSQPDQFAQTAQALSRGRSEIGMSIQEVSKKIGIATTRIQYFESLQFDSLDIISTKQLQTYIDFLGIRCDIPINRVIQRPIGIDLDEPLKTKPLFTWKKAKKNIFFVSLFLLTCLYTYQDIIKQSFAQNAIETKTVAIQRVT